jgi:hypothetical protein
MNLKRLIIAMVVGFLCFFFSDFFIHGFWLRPDYVATAALWRTDAEMQSRFIWMVAGHLLYAIAFVLIWAKGFAGTGCTRCALVFGTTMGLFYQANTLITYVVSPLPPSIALKWFLSGLAQSIVLAVVTRFVYKPKDS